MKITCKYLPKLMILSLVFSSVLACKGSKGNHDNHHHGHDAGHHDEYIRGPHGGRLLEHEGFALELKIFEKGVPPQYRLYPYKNNEPLPAKEVKAEVKLQRLGAKPETFAFRPVDDFLLGDKEVYEPHSFDVSVKASYQGKTFSWEFASHEGRTEIPEVAAKAAKISTEIAASRVIETTTKVRGKIVPSEHKIAHIIPRYAGLVREGRKHIGDRVEKNEIIAVIESNQSLQPFEIRSPIAGQVISGHVVAGEFVPANEEIYIVADLSEVWADFYVPLREQLSVKLNQKLRISSVIGNKTAEAKISYVAPHADEKSQSQLLRVSIANKDNDFMPGMFVTGKLVTNEIQADVAVRNSAIQMFRDWQVVFLKVGNTYEIRPLELGVTDGTWTQVLQGLNVNDEYVSKNAFVVKADILKSGASHDH